MSRFPSESTPSAAAQWLGRLRRTARNLLVAQRLGWVIACVLGMVLIGGVLDYVLRTPTPLRVVLWLSGIAVLATALYRVVWPAIRFNPSLTEVALRVENSEMGGQAGLRGVLASGLELAHAPAADPGRRLAEPVILDATRRLGGVRAAGLVAPTRTVRSLIWMFGAVAAVVLVGVLEPTLARIGAERVLWPFTSVQWPRRTAVVDITGVKIHPLGSALALRAALTRSGTALNQTRVAAMYRTITDGDAGPTRRVLLTSQDKSIRLEAPAGGTGHLFERLLEPSGLAADMAANTGTGVALSDVTLEYWFETEDDRTEPARVLLVEPPAVRGATAAVRLPEYAAGLAERFPELAKAGGGGGGGGRLDLGPGTDERAAPAPILAGSTVTLTIELNKAVPGLPAVVPDAKVWLERTLGADALGLWMGDEESGGPSRAEVRTEGAVWTITWTLTEPVRFAARPVDEHGIAGVEEAAFRFDTLQDNPPTATVTVPGEDESVLATALVELGGEGRDDVGLSWVGLERQLARRPAGSEGAPTEPAEERVEMSRTEGGAIDARASSGEGDEPRPDSRRVAVTTSLDLSTLELKPGDELWITAAAMDAYELNGARHEVARSGVRKLRIMSREELIGQIWSELGSVRRTAVKIDEDQRELNKNVAKPGAEDARRSQRAQAGITERVARQADALEKTRERVEQNGLTDQGLQDVIRQAEESLDKAGERSNEASQALSDAAQAASRESMSPEAGKQERLDADAAQQEVREELAKLIDMLDQGEDTYASKRALEELIKEQQALQQRTQQAGQRTTGKSAEGLTPQEKQELDQIAEEQEQAADKLREAVEKMAERAEKMEKDDPASAQAMAQAAQRARREQTEEKMQEAAQQARQNQTNNAQQRQQQAVQSMQQMLQELEKAGDNKDEVLRRFLASLMDSIRGLIRQQEDQLAALDGAIEKGSLKGLDTGMARLHQNTLGVLDQAAGGPREAQEIAELIERAADAQAAATVGLRDDPVNEDEVKAQEQLSLDKLNEALTQAETMDQEAEERQQEQKRAELKKKYAEALAAQVSIREGSLGLVGAEATRRNRAAARELGAAQATLRDTLAAIRDEVAEIKEAKVFDYAHTRLDVLTETAAAALNVGLPTQATVRGQASAVRILQSLVEALGNSKNDRPFREREREGSGGGGGQGQQPLVPPAAELKLLKAMQQETADLTREVAETARPEPGMVEEAGRLQRELSEQGSELLERLSRRPGAPEVVPGGDNPAEPDAPAEPDPSPPASGPSSPR